MRRNWLVHARLCLFGAALALAVGACAAQGDQGAYPERTVETTVPGGPVDDAGSDVVSTTSTTAPDLGPESPGDGVDANGGETSDLVAADEFLSIASVSPEAFAPPFVRDPAGTPDKHPLEAATLRPPWLGLRELPSLPPGRSAPWPTPLELTNRQFPTVWSLADDPSDPGFVGTRSEVPPDVAARSSWRPSCPVEISDLAYLTLTHWGFDGRRHTGELLVHRDSADGMISAFRRMYELRFPIEELRVKGFADMQALVTGDSNITSAFECRRSIAAGRWSEHAYGRAIDINPFHNPYLKRNLIIPQLSTFYTDRSLDLPGMISSQSAVIDAFTSIGWQWGGDWESAKDWMHFSANGN